MLDVNKFPASLLKFDAYIKLTDSLDDAIKVVKKRRLAYGQPCIVTYKAKVNEQGKPGYHILFAIGSMNPDEPYFINVYQEDNNNYVTIEELASEIYNILEEFSGKIPVRIKVGAQPNINETQFKDGDIILGGAAIKQVLDKVEENSDNLPTSAAVYKLFKTLSDSLGEIINGILENLNENNNSISHLNELVPVINKLDSSVDALYITVGKHDSSINELYDIVEDSSDRIYSVAGGRGILVETENRVSTISVKYDELMSDIISSDDTALQLDSNNKLGVYWNGF